MNSETDNANEDATSNLITRRRVIGLSAVATCGIATGLIIRKNKSSNKAIVKPESKTLQPTATNSTEPSRKWFNSLFYSTAPVKGIPQSWVDAKGLDVLRYANYIQDLRLKNITPYHVLYPHFKTRGGTSNSLPPRYLWRHIAPVLKVIDKMATHMNAKVKPLVSVYRSPAYNRLIKGKSKSQHLFNRAVDIQFYGVSAYTVAKVARKFRAAGHFKGGIGINRQFTHIDTRGHNADW